MSGTITSNPNDTQTILYNGHLVKIHSENGKTFFVNGNNERVYVDLSSPTWFAEVIKSEASDKKQELKNEARAEYLKYDAELKAASKERTVAYKLYRLATNCFNINRSKYNELVEDVDGNVDELAAPEQKEAEEYQIAMGNAKKDKLAADIEFTIKGYQVADANKMRHSAKLREIGLC